MERMDVRKYLARIGYQGPTQPSLENLKAIHERHILSVPFGSLSIHCGERIVPEVPLLYRKIVEQQRGGFCYELNGLFSWLLEELGYRVSLLSGQVRNTFTEHFGPPFDHLVLLVEFGDGRRWLCDVGFGNAFRKPLPLEAGRAERQDNGVFGLHEEGGSWELRRTPPGGSAEATLYKFTLEGQRREDFRPMCEYHQTSPSSIFFCKSFCSLHLPGGMITYMGKRLITTEYTSEREEKITTQLTEEQIPHTLKERFGITLRNKLIPKDQDIVPPSTDF
ncbi:arylamine N-acetyltransferase, pineal gland isozyme NAT-3-like isoform X1 [Scyliorhinus torazame]|uniref:arylamine N-acetyltransferase, pineal gland isozyme NAT-3-like isoform X1 n=2 Tax=Scyliorhinus torazame TaxID=75743 RepID=UPI003B58BB79